MAYVFDPINNTLIDDEDKSLGNKLQLMDGGRVNFDIGTNLTSAQKKQTLYTKLLKELPEGYLEDYKKVFLIENKDGTFSRKSGDAGGIQFMKEKYGNVIKDIKTRQGNVKNIDRKIGEFNSAILQDLQKNNKIVSALDDSDLKRGSRIKTTAPFDAKGSKNFNFHHIMNIGGEIPLDTNDIAVISKTMNAKLSPYNKNLNNISDAISTLINEQPKNYLKRIDKLNDQAEGIVKKAVKELPKEYKNLIGFNRVVPVLDEYGTPINFVGKKVGGSNQNKPGIKLENLTNKQATALRKQIKTDALSFEKAGLKDKILSSTGKVLKGVGKVIKPVGYAIGTKALFDAQALAKEQGIELSNFDKLLAVDSGDPNVAINNYMRRNDPEFAAAERAKDLAQMEDDFEEVGLDEIQPDETLKSFMANGGRAGFNNGGAAGADVNFATQLEYF